ncbi:hypothetical protein GCM10009811_12380 [Nostocoides veronense]|uniref:Uncharacterized protein n=1 Tax=Nostocoides veronense TaxID=330836 RepID=A0ABN2LHZ6_9MICO
MTDAGRRLEPVGGDGDGGQGERAREQVDDRQGKHGASQRPREERIATGRAQGTESNSPVRVGAVIGEG